MQSIIRDSAAAFVQRCAAMGTLLSVYANPTEEIRHDLSRGKAPRMHFAAGQRMLAAGGGAEARLEENYLFDTRRFASGAVSAGEYVFFASAIGQPGANNGFVSPMVMTDVETNMDTPSQIAQGKDYVLWQIGISFNADILAADAALLLEIGALRFEKQGGQFTLKHGPGRFWPGGMGAVTPLATSNTASNGSKDIRATRKLAVPRVLRAKDTFAYKYVVPRAVRNLDNSTAISLTGNCLMTIWLWGGQRDAIPV